MSLEPSAQQASSERTEELCESLAEIRARVTAAAGSAPASEPPQKLVAVSKYKPSSDISVCFNEGQRDFGENYVQELVDKANELPLEIRWHFIGTLQSNKAKLLASIPNLHTVQTLSSEKVANALNKALPPSRTTPLNILIQINTSGEDAKSGLPPLTASSICTSPSTSPSSNSPPSELQKLAKHIITSCPNLRLQGLMTIGSLDQSLSAKETDQNADFERLKETRDILQKWLQSELGESSSTKGEETEGVQRWGDEGTGKLLLSMGMSSDFEAALKAGSDIVRVGTGIFGSRKTKDEMKRL
ncbi:hypothetical protein GYMLUDRAFT_48803 [Collybiopsis luxurians FD-317 M1]|uniref:Pyridoxal phosphate homeostasis protein n=1 Tax=Collybiopsis luxurians FD-317 M1 TaxID=944289 RepID=A0A0D0CHR4_9AGAR|nr:hypothetical protein GYMLUDRAFT_48803 [Collybiopsis luxurians FD-317 M1]